MKQEVMKKEIHDIIDHNLPAMAAKQMREFIVQQEEVRQNLDESEAVVERQVALIAEYKNMDVKYGTMEKMAEELNLRKDSLDNQELVVQKREDRIDIMIAELRLECVSSNMENMKQLVNKVFGHPSVSITRQVPVSAGEYNAQGQFGGGETLMDAKETTLESKS